MLRYWSTTRVASVAFLVAVMALAVVAPAQADVQSYPYPIQQLTTNEYDDTSPQIHNGQITWQGSGIWYWDGTNFTHVAGSGEKPQIHSGEITWVDPSNVWYWNGSTHQVAACGIPPSNPQIYDGWIVFQAGGIWYRRMSTGDPYNHDISSSGQDPQIDNGQITWWGGGIWYWDGTKTQLASTGENPQIHNGQVTWWGWDGTDYDIYLWNGATTTNITDDDADHRYPQIYNSKLVWQSDGQIYYYDGGTISQLSSASDSTLNSDAQIWNSTTVWHGYDGTDNEIFYWNGSDVYQVTDNDYDDMFPQIWGAQITWQAQVGEEDWEIMEAHIPDPATMTLFTLGLLGLAARLRRRRT